MENTPFDKVLLRGIHLDQPWHEEVANLLARRYQIAGFSRELMINDFAILRNICGDKHPAEVFLPQLEEKVLRGQTQSTRQAYCARIRSIFNSLRMLGVIPINHRPDDGLPKIRTIRAAPRPLSKEQAILLMTQAQYPYNEWFQFACLAGLRAMEVAAISGSWLEHHGEADMLRIYGKGNTELLIPAHPKLSELIKSKHTLSRLYNVKPNHLSRMACQEMRRMGIAVGKQDNSRLSFHSCRHFFATEILQTSGGNLITTQRLMRHQSPVVTARYADVTNNEQRIAMGKLLLDIQWPEFSPPPKLTN